MPIMMYSKSKICTGCGGVFIIIANFQEIQESLKPQSSLALPGNKSCIFKKGSCSNPATVWGITTVPASLPPK